MIELGTKVVVTTDKRGVFFGILAARDGSTVELGDARNCVYWSAETRGFLGLCAHGPQPGSRVGPAAPLVELRGVTSVSVASDEAVKAWEAAPWK